MRSDQYGTALVNFLIAALTGLTLRLAFVKELPIDYFNLQHAHSHTAMFGWVYMALFTLLNASFPPEPSRSRDYKKLFWITESSVAGLFLAFLFQGYGLVSILFFGIHILLSYIYAYNRLRDIKGERGPSYSLLRAALIWLLISSAGFWGMGTLHPLGMGNSPWYHMASQFFLHFQLTGWFTFGVLALLFKEWENKGWRFSRKGFRGFFWLTNVGAVLTFALAIAWVSSHPLSYAVNGLGVFIQLIALGAFIKLILSPLRKFWRTYSSTIRILFAVGLTAFLLRTLFQSALVVPEVAEMAHTIRNLVIGFIHLSVLGFVTPFLMGFATHRNLLREKRTTRAGLGTLITGIFLTEVGLFLQGLFFWMEWGYLPHYHLSLFLTSLLLPAGLLIICLSPLTGNRKSPPQPRFFTNG